MNLTEAKTVAGALGEQLADLAAATDSTLGEIRREMLSTQIDPAAFDRAMNELFDSIKGYFERSFKPLAARVASLEAEAQVRKALSQ